MAFSDSWMDDPRNDHEAEDGNSITVTSRMPTGPSPISELIASAKPRSPIAEVRVVDKDTGGEKGSKLARFDLLPARPLRLLAEHYGKGAEKYDARNWERGYAWSLTYAALMRHANAFWDGEDFDAESGSHHMVAVAWHALALVEFALTHPEKDDRP